MTEKTLAELWVAEANKVPVMTYQNKVRIQYNGEYRISAIKALRSVTGLTLKAAKEATEWRGGLLICPSVLVVLNNCYQKELARYGKFAPNDWHSMPDPAEPIEL